MREHEDKSCEERRRHRKGNAQTFRRGRAVVFMQQLEKKREVIKRQIDMPELASIRDVLIGELKAVEMILEEFKVAFDLEEVE